VSAARAGTQTSRNAADRTLRTTDCDKQLGVTLQGKTLMLSHAQAPGTAATKTTKTHDRESLHGAVVGSYAGVTPRLLNATFTPQSADYRRWRGANHWEQPDRGQVPQSACLPVRIRSKAEKPAATKGAGKDGRGLTKRSSANGSLPPTVSRQPVGETLHKTVFTCAKDTNAIEQRTRIGLCRALSVPAASGCVAGQRGVMRTTKIAQIPRGLGPRF
jgi:hypothetical protein